MKKEILEELKDWNELNEKLYKEKAKLEERILSIDIQLWNLSARYDDLCKKLLTTTTK
jgi:hypothetical protein